MAIQKVGLNDTFSQWQDKNNIVASEQGDLSRLLDRGIDTLYRRGSGLTINVATLSGTNVATATIGSGGTNYKKYDVVEIENANYNKAWFRIVTVNASGVVSAIALIASESLFTVAQYPAKTTVITEINKLEESKLYRGGDTMTGALDIAANLSTSSGGTATFAGLTLANGGLTVADGTTFTALGAAIFGNAIGDTVQFVSGALTFSNATTVAVASTLNFDSNTFVLDATNNRIGINKAVPTVSLDSVGDVLLTSGTTIFSATSASGFALTGNTTITGTQTTTVSTTVPILQGSTAASGTLTLRSTSSATKAAAGILLTDNISSTSTTTGSLVITGGLGISQNTWIGGTLNSAGNFNVSAGTATVSGLITANGGLTVADGTTFTANGSVVFGNLNTDTITFNSAVWSIPSATTVAITSTLNFDSNTLVIDGVNNRIGINKAVPTVSLDSVGDTLLTTGSNVLSLTSASGTTITGNLTTSGINTLNLVTDSSSSTTGAVIIAGGVGIAKKLYVGTNLTVTTDITSPIHQGSIAASGTLTLRSTSSVTKAAAGILMTDGIASTSTTTGTLAITGGLGISGATWVGGLLNVAGNATLQGTLGVTLATTLSSTLGVTGDVAVNTNKFNITAASGNTTIAGTLGVTGDVAVNTNKFNITALTGAFTAAGNATLQGTLGVTLATTLSSTLAVTGDININTNKFNIVAASGNTTIAGTLGVTLATTLSSTLAVTGNVNINTNKFNIVAASGNTTIAGTLGVTGNITLSGTGNSVGTITSGIWNGTLISTAKGGTGQDLSAASGYLKFTAGTAATITSIPSADIVTILASKTLNACTVTGGLTVGTGTVISIADAPILDTSAANKLYVDIKTGGFQVKVAVLGATTAALPSNTYNNAAGTITSTTNSVLPVIDGVTYIVGNRILVKDQNTGATSPPSDISNGVYVVSSLGSVGVSPWVLTRSTDADSNTELNNALVIVSSGTLSGGISYLNSASPVTLGTTLLKWEIAGSSFNAGEGLVKNGGNIDVVGTTNRIVVSADSIDIGSDVATLSGNQTFAGDCQFTNKVKFGAHTSQYSGTVTTSSVATVTLDSFPVASARTCKYIIQAATAGNIHVTEFLVTKSPNAGNDVIYLEYGTGMSASLFSVVSSYDGANVNLQVTPTSTTSTVFKFNAELINI